MWSFVAFVAFVAGLCAGIYMGTKRALLAFVCATLLPSVADVLLLRWLYGADAFVLITLAINLTVAFVVSFLTLSILSFGGEVE